MSADDTSTEREEGDRLMPKFGADGLLTGVVVDAQSRNVLMVAHLDREALDATLETGLAHFHSRSRGKLWCKGETSGNVLRVQDILVDCDQDAIVLIAEAAGPTCHTNRRSCFYRKLGTNGRLEPVSD